MNKITTNYNYDTKLVLVNDENDVIAVINVPTAIIVTDITEKVRLAIKENLQAKEVVFEQAIDIGEFESIKEVPFIYSDEDEEEFSNTYRLIKTEEY